MAHNAKEVWTLFHPVRDMYVTSDFNSFKYRSHVNRMWAALCKINMAGHPLCISPKFSVWNEKLTYIETISVNNRGRVIYGPANECYNTRLWLVLVVPRDFCIHWKGYGSYVILYLDISVTDACVDVVYAKVEIVRTPVVIRKHIQPLCKCCRKI
jgi:hypothetical protein